MNLGLGAGLDWAGRRGWPGLGGLGWSWLEWVGGWGPGSGLGWGGLDWAAPKLKLVLNLGWIGLGGGAGLAWAGRVEGLGWGASWSWG